MPAIDLAEHRRQVEAYIRLRPAYVTFAQVLRRVLENGTRGTFPGALVQTRAKDVSSFAEKAARKFDKYHDPVNQLTDLCGGRVTVQTLEQVQAVKQFVEANFTILERDDKTQRLEEDRFGYRDMHYIVQLRGDRDLGITPDERAAIGTRKAEIQVRTWVQHAWADTLHDRIYKTPLRLSAETRRVANLLAAVLEEGDRTLDRLARQTDEMQANYSAHASRADVEKETAVLEAVLANLPPDADPIPLTLRLARLLTSAHGNYAKAAELLAPLAQTTGPWRRDVLTELGFALCKAHRTASDSPEFRQGQALLEEALDLGQRHNGGRAVDTGQSRSLQARGWSRLAWSWAGVDDERAAALNAFRKALELEPANPYYLAELLGFEAFAARTLELSAATRILAEQALATCREHALAGIEMPYACFTGGRLSLLLGDGSGALAWYARSLCYCRQASVCVPGDALENERLYVRRLAVNPRPDLDWVRELLHLAGGQPPETSAARAQKAAPTPKLALPALIVAGGASSLAPNLLEPARAMLGGALAAFRGTVISGGTTAGVPGCVGAAAADLAAVGSKTFALVGYLPSQLPIDAPLDTRYDRHVVCGDTFSAQQILRMWWDLLAAGANPGDVQVLGIGGGTLSALEYRIGLALGATVGVMMKSGGAAEALLADELWVGGAGEGGEPRLLPLPADAQTLRAFVQGGTADVADAAVEEMSRELHERHMARRMRQSPGQLRPWNDLEETYRAANRAQARYVISILTAAGFGVRPAPAPRVFTDFTPAELERMAELEHGRWNVERLRAGWRPGEIRDNARMVHNLIAPWSDKALDRYRQDDIDTVRAFPEILAKAGLEVFRKS